MATFAKPSNQPIIIRQDRVKEFQKMVGSTKGSVQILKARSAAHPSAVKK